MKLSDAQIKEMKRLLRRDYPAGEPRLSWLNKATAKALLARGLIAEREGSKTSSPFSSNIIDLTEAGRAALAAVS